MVIQVALVSLCGPVGCAVLVWAGSAPFSLFSFFGGGVPWFSTNLAKIVNFFAGVRFWFGVGFRGWADPLILQAREPGPGLRAAGSGGVEPTGGWGWGGVSWGGVGWGGVG